MSKKVRSLWRKPPPTPVDLNDRAAVKRFDDSCDPQKLLASSLATIDAAAERAVTDPKCPNGSEHAHEIRMWIARLQHMRVEGDDAVIHAALKLAEAWMQMRVDALFARDVRSREASMENLPGLIATDEQIRAALREHDTQLQAALSLGIDERQIRRRISPAERRRIRTEKKPDADRRPTR